MAFAPPAQGGHEQQGERDLRRCQHAVSRTPGTGLAQGQGRDQRADSAADAPRSVQPVHVPGAVVPGHEPVEGGVDRAATQAGDHRRQQHQPPTRRQRIERQRGAGQQAAGDQNLPGAETLEQPGGGQAGERHSRGGQQDRLPGGVERQGEVATDSGPDRAQDGVGQAQADEGDVDDRQEPPRHRLCMTDGTRARHRTTEDTRRPGCPGR